MLQRGADLIRTRRRNEDNTSSRGTCVLSGAIPIVDCFADTGGFRQRKTSGGALQRTADEF